MRLLCPWDFPGKNTGGGCHFLLQGIFLTHGSNPSLLHWQANFLPQSHLGSLGTLIIKQGHMDRAWRMSHHMKDDHTEEHLRLRYPAQWQPSCPLTESARKNPIETSKGAASSQSSANPLSKQPMKHEKNGCWGACFRTINNPKTSSLPSPFKNLKVQLFYLVGMLRTLSPRGSIPVALRKLLPLPHFLRFCFSLGHFPSCKILASRPGIEPEPLAVKTWSLNHWTTR